MTRYGRYNHVLVSQIAKQYGDGTSQPEYTFLCGKASVLPDFITEPDKTTCPDCAKKHWAQRLAEHPGFRVEKVPPIEKYGPRSLYKLWRGDEHIAWIYPNNGWGQGWGASGHRVKEEHEATATVANVIPGSKLDYRNAYTSRDEAAVRIIERLAQEASSANGQQSGKRWAELNGVYCAAQYAADCVKHVASRRAAAIRREQEAEEARKTIEANRARFAEEKALATAQLIELYRRADLTNYQRDGLVWAFERLGIAIPSMESTNDLQAV
ncbi:MAG: hypothetical protein NW206_19985 [Hyphomonadaceae bacterium]|nr:hypothetical protein [Hyphomonadaceae bacterium]